MIPRKEEVWSLLGMSQLCPMLSVEEGLPNAHVCCQLPMILLSTYLPEVHSKPVTSQGNQKSKP